KLLNERIIQIQSCIRGYLCRKFLQKRLKSAILIQCCVRRWLARKLLKTLKVEAKSVQRLQNLNKGLENKVISLQQQVDRIVLERNSLTLELEQLRKFNENQKLSTHFTIEQSNDHVAELSNQLTISRKMISQLESKVAEMTNEMESFEKEASTSRMILEKELCRLTDENLNLKASLAMASNHAEPEIPYRNFDVVFDTNPIPCLRAFLIFMAIRNEDQRKKTESIAVLLDKFYDTVTDCVMASSDFQKLTMWMSNVWRLMQLLRQYSGEEEYATQNTPSQSNDQLKNCDLCLQRSSLCNLLLIIHQKMIQEVYVKKLTPSIIVSSILEHHDSRNLSKMNSGGLINELNLIFDCFQTFGVEWPLFSQIFSHLFHYIEAHALNVLMSRRDLCNFSRSIEIKHNIKTLLNWLQDHNLLQNDGELGKLFEATNLIQIRKSEPEDIKTLAGVTTHLNLAQINKLLAAYSPTESFEPKLKPDFIRKMNMFLKNERNLDEKLNNNELPWQRTVIKSTLNFPYVQSNLVFSEIDLPEALWPYIS
uniref:Dilute domain-containing protein n=1 Tax=Romanomermis culicivorax TaxID=13658 RepID=A0A915L138_ROMCU